MERVEIDEWTVDLMTTFPGLSEWIQSLPEEERKLFETGTGKKRWTLTLAICARTRCIVAMVLTPSAKASAAVKALTMILSDKGAWSDAVKAHGRWDMHGLPEMIVTDCGIAFRSEQFQRVCADLGITVQRTIAGHPELRGAVERVFRTISWGLIPHLAGRCFSNVVEKGDADPADSACLTTNDLAFALERWVIDVYHNTPHEGLDGETPLECWRRTAGEHGVRPLPDTRTLRTVFGQRLYRTLSKEGLTVLGVNYHSEELAQWFLDSRQRELEIRWLHSDIGWIEVRLGERWVPVPAVIDGLDQVRAPLWMKAVREVRTVDPDRKKHDEAVIQRALRAIIDRSDAAEDAAGLLVDEWSPQRLEQEEKRLFIGFNIRGPQKPKSRGTGIGRSIPDLDDAEKDASDVPSDTAAPNRRRRTGKFKLEG